jgi:hypothetical protein
MVHVSPAMLNSCVSPFLRSISLSRASRRCTEQVQVDIQRVRENDPTLLAVGWCMQVADAAVQALAEALRTNTWLLTLDFSCVTGVTDVGWARLTDALPDSVVSAVLLRETDVSDEHKSVIFDICEDRQEVIFDGEVMRITTRAAVNDPHLNVINLDTFIIRAPGFSWQVKYIHDRHMVALAEALRGNTHVRRLVFPSGHWSGQYWDRTAMPMEMPNVSDAGLAVLTAALRESAVESVRLEMLDTSIGFGECHAPIPALSEIDLPSRYLR